MKNIIVSFGTTGLLQVINLATGVLAARYLLPEGRGELAAILLWPGLLGAIFLFSAEQAVTYFAATREGAARRVAAVALIATIPLALVAMAVGYVVIPHLMHAHDPAAIALSRIYLLQIPVHIASMIFVGTMQGAQRFAAWNAIRLMPSVGYLVGILVFVAFGQASVTGFVIASLGGSTAAFIIGFVQAARIAGMSWQPIRGEFPELARYAVSAHFSHLATIGNRQLDKALVALLLPSEQLGVYVVALSAAAIVGLVGTTLGPISMARIAQATGQDQRTKMLGRYLRLTIAIAAPVACVFAVAGNWLVAVVFGDAFLLAGQVLPILLAGAFANATRDSFYAALRAHAQLRLISYAEYTVLALQAALLFFLIPTAGIHGAAWAITVSAFAGLAIAAAAVAKLTGQTIVSLVQPARADWHYLVRTSRSFVPNFSRVG